MKVCVVGPQHSCTRYIVCLLDKHPNISFVGHIGSNFPTIRLEKFDKFVIVSRDENCINKSNEKYNEKTDLGTIGIKNINKILEKVFINNIDKIIFFSFETFFSYKNHYLHTIFQDLRLDPNNYDYKFKKKHSPLTKSKKKRWFRINLKIKNCKKKYLI